MDKNVLIVGATGCVGHYLVEELASLPGYRLHLLVRNRQKLKFNPDLLPQVAIVDAGLGDFDQYADLLPEIDYVINLATAWGDPQVTEQVNIAYPIELYNRLNPERCRRIFHFSTASILDQHHQLLPEAKTLGTDYIRTKYLCYEQLASIKLADRVTTMFPTLILGGGKDKPYSHIAGGVPDLIKWFGAIQWLRCDASFHFIHAQDIARILVYLLSETDIKPLYVLGNPNVTVNDCIERAAAYLGKKVPFTYQLSLARAHQLVKWLPISMEPWDEFCMDYRHFRYQSVHTQTFGLSGVGRTVEEVLMMYSSKT